jgi:hypothetical protein
MRSHLPALLAATALLAACSSPAEQQGTAGTGASGGAGSTGSGGAGSGGSPGACEPVYGPDVIHLAAPADLAPGSQATTCLRWTTPETIDITAYQGFLGPTGHHSLLLARTAGAEPDGLGPCSEAEIMDAQTKGAFQMLAGVSYESDGQRFAFPTSPVQVGLRVAANTQLVFDAHYLNTTGKDTTGCATLDLERGAPVFAALQFRTVVPPEQYTLTVPAHGSIDVAYEEPAGGKYRIAAASAHMHEGGTHFRMTIKETGQVLYEGTNWADPVPAVYDTQKIVVEAGQTFMIECSFTNDGAVDQHFPQQMCVGGMYLLACTLPGAC